MNQSEHLLVCLIEECAEVIKDTSKALRFGLDDSYIKSDKSNREKIEREFIELTAVHQMLIEQKILNISNISREIFDDKINRVNHFVKYAEEKGTINENS